MFFSIYLQLYWQCKCKSCDSYRRPSGEAFVSSVEKEHWTLESFACCGKSAKRWWCWWWILWSYKKSINNNDVDNVLVSQLLIKATYFLYWFNYLFCDIELCVIVGGGFGLQWSAIQSVCHTVALCFYNLLVWGTHLLRSVYLRVLLRTSPLRRVILRLYSAKLNLDILCAPNKRWAADPCVSACKCLYFSPYVYHVKVALQRSKAAK